MMDRMRQLAGAACGALAFMLLATGCAPDPTATPAPTGFSSEEEAFAAAEATYRAYVDAVNARRSDPASQPDPSSMLTASAYNDHVETQRALAERGWRVDGNTQLSSVEHLTVSIDAIEIAACIDASGTRVLSSDGTDVTPTDRDEVLEVEVTVVPISGTLRIGSSIASGAEC